MKTLLRKSYREHLDFCIVALVIAAFAIIASQRLGTVPLPETDEAYILQVPYEMLNRGQLSWPMYRYLGGNIENVWHTFFPLFFVVLSGFFKVFGWGLLQGRVFTLISASLVLLMVYLIGRRLSNWRVGLGAVLLLVGDQVFFERSRLLRYDFTAACFAMLAFYLFDKAEQTKRGGYYVASGLAAGAGVMCHTNVLYMFAAIALLMLLGRGWRIITQKNFYQYALSALAVMSYVIVYDLVDYKNFVQQNRGDKLHFGILQPLGFWNNLIEEGSRYTRWLSAGQMFLNVPRTTLRVFQWLTIAAIIYLIVYTAAQINRRDWLGKPAARILIVTTATVLFHALITSNKNVYYMAHLSPWFALCVGIMLNDSLNLIGRLRNLKWPRENLLHRAASVAIAMAVIAFALQLARQNRRYIREVRNPELVQFEEIKSVLRSVVPEGVCPVAVKSPVMWLAFPEHDRCFATIEERMMESLDLDGNEYAVLAPYAYDKARVSRTRDLDAKYPLIAELKGTRLGAIRVYYTGANPQYKALQPKTYYFFGESRGLVTGEQIAGSREVWSADAGKLSSLSGSSFRVDNGEVAPIEFPSIQLKPGAIYQLVLDATAKVGRWDITVVDEKSGTALRSERIRELPEPQRIESLFKTVNAGSVKLVISPIDRNHLAPLRLSRISVREVLPDYSM